MNKSYLEKMSLSELDEYGKVLGIPKLIGNAEDRIRTINKRRSKTVNIRALGVDWTVPVKAMSDKRVVDLASKLNDSNAEEALRLVLGDDQFKLLQEVCTEEDGTFDVNALSVVYVKIFTSKELKNA